MRYVACRGKYPKHRLSADHNHVILQRELFGKSEAKSLPAAGITSIPQVEFYQKNHQSV